MKPRSANAGATTPDRQGGILTSALLAGLWVLPTFACDRQETEADSAMPSASAEQQTHASAEVVAEASVDLEAVLKGIDEGTIADAADLEAKLNDPEAGLAKVDIDGDGTLDKLVVVERRDEATATAVFEIRAVSNVDVEVDIEAAPVVAEIQFVADVEDNVVVAEAEFKHETRTNVESRSETRVRREWRETAYVERDEVVVSARSAVFVTWVFAVERPLYVASVHVSVHAHRAPDPCWPPGHCKHGHWKASHHNHVRIHAGPGHSGKVKTKVKIRSGGKGPKGGKGGKGKKR